MLLELRINALIKEYNDAWDLSDDGTMHQYSLIESWRWQGYSPPSDSTVRRVHALIAEATMNECLTSPSEYIRELKRWLNQ